MKRKRAWEPVRLAMRFLKVKWIFLCASFSKHVWGRRALRKRPQGIEEVRIENSVMQGHTSHYSVQSYSISSCGWKLSIAMSGHRESFSWSTTHIWRVTIVHVHKKVPKMGCIRSRLFSLDYCLVIIATAIQGYQRCPYQLWRRATRISLLPRWRDSSSPDIGLYLCDIA